MDQEKKKSNLTLILIFVFIIVGGIVLWMILIDWAKDTRDTGKQWVALGKEYGRSTNGSGCLEKALGMNEQCDGLRCAVYNKVFLSACLKSSQPEAGFCQHVPRSYSILEAAAWEVEQCEKRNNNHRACNDLFKAVHKFCTDRNTKAPPPG